MRQLTIAERLTAAVLLPLIAALSGPFLTATLLPSLDKANITYAEIFLGFVAVGIAGAVVLVIARGIVRPLAEVADTIDALAYAELDSSTALPPSRGEIARLLIATDRLAEVIGERQRRELVHNDLDRTLAGRAPQQFVQPGTPGRVGDRSWNSADHRRRLDLASQGRRHVGSVGGRAGGIRRNCPAPPKARTP